MRSSATASVVTTNANVMRQGHRTPPATTRIQPLVPMFSSTRTVAIAIERRGREAGRVSSESPAITRMTSITVAED